jgi:hypothetical protein
MRTPLQCAIMEADTVGLPPPAKGAPGCSLSQSPPSLQPRSGIERRMPSLKWMRIVLPIPDLLLCGGHVPYSPARACRYPLCPMLTRDASGYCAEHRHLAGGGQRPSSGKRGYGPQWRRIRERILRIFGIPRQDWHLWDVDHSPPYDPAIEPDHLKYTLTPRQHADHSSKTASRDGGFGNTRTGAG